MVKNKNEKLSHFLMIVYLVIVMAAIIAKFFLPADLWKNLVAAVSVSAALFALSDLYQKASDSRRNLSILSAGIIDPVYTRFDSLGYFRDASGAHMAKASYSSDYDFDQFLRTVTDGKERALRELVWEKKGNDKRRKQSRGYAVSHTVLLVLSLLVLVGPAVLIFFFPQYYPQLDETFLEVLTLCSFVFTFAVALAGASNLGSLKKIQMLLNLKERCADIDPASPSVPAPAPSPVVVMPSAPVQAAAPAPVAPVSEPASESSAETDLSDSEDHIGSDWKPLDD
ncbi:MAG: hypothetical protein K6C08_01080 [Oscillospiraceae bacterium]|nr:hypothetical protein [Oscillospiraceae bacterium]